MFNKQFAPEFEAISFLAASHGMAARVAGLCHDRAYERIQIIRQNSELIPTERVNNSIVDDGPSNRKICDLH